MTATRQDTDGIGPVAASATDTAPPSPRTAPAQGRAPAGRLPLAAALLALALIPLINVAVPRHGRIAVVGSPWAGTPAVIDLVARADGAVIAGSGFANVVVAASDAPGFAARLYRAGAWLVLDPLLIAGCTPRPTRMSP